ncbi:hypothetical protein [Sphaerisporangium sp. NPDC051011]|uniref:hypothetical protein n=1 Tax=Sphaerisporangium sp. NPDC051011 TaxID=3155792 RepID=UPI0033C3DB77
MSELQRAGGFTLPVPSRVGQAAVVEQSRAVGEVYTAMVAARENPRNIDRAVAEMEYSCKQLGLAERAFYSYSRSGEAVTGPSIHLARELARCWGNVHHGLHELRRDDEAHLSEMQAFAWDVEKNLRVAHTFIVPHKSDEIDGIDGPKVLTDLRDIYENNTGNGARRVRQAIFAVLPPWYVERAKELCEQTLAAGRPDVTPEQRAADVINDFAGGGVTQEQLEQKLGKPVAEWSLFDVAQLEVLYRSLRRREITRDKVFPPAEKPVTFEEIGVSPSAPDAQAKEPPSVPPPAPTAGAAASGEEPRSGAEEPPTTGEAEPPTAGEPEPPATGEPEPPAVEEPGSGTEEPPAAGEAKPATAGEAEPPPTGEAEPPTAGEPEPPATGEPEPPAVEELLADRRQLRKLNARFTRAGIAVHTGRGSVARNEQARLAWLAEEMHIQVTSTKQLTAAQATRAIDALREAKADAARSRAATERRIAQLFDGLDTSLSAEDQLRDLSGLLGKTVMGPKDITDEEQKKIVELLVTCEGQVTAWDAEVDAAEARRQQPPGSGHPE